MPQVYVKWGGKKIEVNADTQLEPLVFKSQLFELTGVTPDRQKVIIKGRTLKDDSWEDIILQEGALLMMIGSSAPLPQEMDSTNEEKEQHDEVKEQVILPAGLKNLGNTCYMNATLQSFKVIPELSNSLKSYTGSFDPNDRTKSLVLTLKQLYQEMDKSTTKVQIPFLVLHVLHQLFPQFATKNERGEPQQQDANECFTEVLRSLANEVDLVVEKGGEQSKNEKLTSFFETKFDCKLKCLEAEGESEQSSTEKHFQLSCFLTQEVRYLQLGIKSKMTEEIEKFSSSLQKNAKYQKTSLISRLPAYLSIQMVRFFYKEKENINAKILKDVKFPMNLDVFDLCTDALKEKLRPMRDLYKIYDDKVMEDMKLAKMDVDRKDKNVSKPTKFHPYSFADDVGSNNSGFYELKAIITHKGRSSDSGHYVGWVRIGGDKWVMCDDDEVQSVAEEDILKLSGGGDWHCAYVLLYGPRPLPNED